MPTYHFEAMDPQGEEIRDIIEAATQDEAQATIRAMGYFVTKITVQKTAKTQATSASKKGIVLGGVSGKKMVQFTRQLSILQDAGLSILRSLRILESQAEPGLLKHTLGNVCEEIEGGASLSEAMAKNPKVFDRLYVNMIKAGEAGGALEMILQRLADFKERAQALKSKITGAMIYPVMVILFTIGILTFIMLFIIPQFIDMFNEFELELPPPTLLLMQISERVQTLWFLFPIVPLAMYLFVRGVNAFRAGRMGWHLYLLKLPVFGKLVEKANLARTTRTLGALVTSGVPIIEGLTITRETSGNAMYEKIYSKVNDSIREGETIADPMKKFAIPEFHPVALFFFCVTLSLPVLSILMIDPTYAYWVLYGCVILSILGGLWYFLKYRLTVVEDLVVNMIDVGEETGELDVMLYKVADYYDTEVTNLTEGMLKLIEPAMVIFLGGVVGFIVISLFMPMIGMISGLT